MADTFQVIQVQNGIVPFTSFSGFPNPLTATVTFDVPFPDTNYTVVISSQADGRCWLAQSQTATGFVINSQSKTLLTGNVYWVAQYINN